MEGETRVTQTKGKPKKPAAGYNVAVHQVEQIVSKVGQKLQFLRSEQGLSLQQLADKSDVSGPSIHKIERSGMVPTITTLLKLSKALGVPFTYFVEEDEDDNVQARHVKSDERNPVYTPHKGLELVGISGPYQYFRAAAAVASMAPGASSGAKLLKHAGEELVMVQSGEVVFELGGKEFCLAKGDALHFHGEVPHTWSNRTDKPAELVWFVLRGD